ncbi:heat shock protein Pss1 [Schizosaccharomyces japonicus yFS275]|uniref:Heat shock protein Pss1 n=1 Tax=Schizosaccharomyces japonicus (strain yFS275 / FY16936) TaxID=402676 RepID=B6K708_SCHJY|nr:heat shock protein Pss1 [Schizosaccharomyces japonicus yFS275]EEB09312.1 heat shock protein Pss1 [Schizosaccharomyces japonicus yFS275]
MASRTNVVGIDLGNSKTTIAVARNRAIDVIVNEVSNRSTPSLVSFGERSRFLGEAAKSQEASNFRNTVGSLKRLAGRKFNDPEVQEIESKFITAPLVEVDGLVGAKVNYLGEEAAFSSTQIIAAYLTKIKTTTEAELKGPVSDVVISVPAWFTNVQRQAVLDAAHIAGLNPLRLMNDNAAAALTYGITKNDLPEPENPRKVAIVDIGHSNYSVSIVAFSQGQFHIKSTVCDRHFGSRNMDKALIDHFAAEFKGKYKIDVLSNPKATFRLATAVERLKKVLSANASAPLNVEMIMNDIDASSFIKREDFEKLIEPLLNRVHLPLEQALKEAGVTKEEIDSIEVVGGCTRVPSLKEKISEFFGKPLSFTLNQDEAIARGCALSCAILSPVFRVRDFHVHDITTYPITFSWEAVPENPDEETSLEVFSLNNPIPSTKILTFYRKAPFTVTATYSHPEQLPGNITAELGKFEIGDVKPTESGDLSIVKVKVRLNLHGILQVEQAYVVEEQEVEEPVEPAPTAEGEEKKDEPVKTRKVKKLVKVADLPIKAVTETLPAEVFNKYLEAEGNMIETDKLVAETLDRKNALEEYIYDTRAKLDDIYAPFASEDEKTKLKGMLMDAEDWLYDEGEDTTKAVYIAKLEDLMRIGGPIRQRYLDDEEAKRQKIQAEREAAMAKLKAQADAKKKKEDAARAKAPTGKFEEGTGGRAPPPPPPQEETIEDQEMTNADETQ